MAESHPPYEEKSIAHIFVSPVAIKLNSPGLVSLSLCVCVVEEKIFKIIPDFGPFLIIFLFQRFRAIYIDQIGWNARQCQIQ